jgi:hypothetical protein
VTYQRGSLLWVWGAIVLCSCTRSHSAGELKDTPAMHSDSGASGGAGRGTAGSADDSSGAANPGKHEPGAPGTKAIAKLAQVGDAAPDAGRALSGTGRFTVTESGVDLAILFNGCPSTVEFRLFIQKGTDCSAGTLAGPHWNGAHGEGIPDVPCIGVSGQGRGAISRAKDDAAPWSIGGSSESDVLGHALVAYDRDSGKPLACGVIMLDDSAPPAASSDAGAASDVSLLGRAQIAGLCLGNSLVRDNKQQCPDPKELSACAQEHCQLDSCIAMCADYLACTTKADDPCSVAFTCEIDQDCSRCQGSVQMCVFSFCAEQISCAAPSTPDGPCSQLRACCALQGDMADSCLELVKMIEKISGDPSCRGVMSDWDFVAHLPVPCMFE